MVGPKRTCTVVDTGVRKPLDLKIHVPVESMVEPDQGTDGRPRPVRGPVRGGEATRKSIWPAIYPELLKLVREHRSTIVFVNNRRAAERLALRLNELAEEEIARAHHGSLAREERLVVEEQLKAGELPCLVASCCSSSASTWARSTSCCRSSRRSRSPPGCSGSAAPATTSATTSKGRIFPKFRADLLECAVVAQRMREGADRDDGRPAQPARRARAADRRDRRHRPTSLAVDELHALVARTHTYAELSRAQLENVLDMLDGRYPSEEFGELRPRIVWDRVAGTIRARKGARALAITNAGTIPDRGLFSVNLPDGRRVGELDEEMVYEARPGQIFLLGASSLADRGDHARPRGRHAGARACRARCRSGRATASGARASSARRSARSRAGRSTRTRRRSSATTTSTRARRATCSSSCASSRRRRASCRATARS